MNSASEYEDTNSEDIESKLFSNPLFYDWELDKNKFNEDLLNLTSTFDSSKCGPNIFNFPGEGYDHPVDYFNLYFDEALYDKMAEQSTVYVNTLIKDDTPFENHTRKIFEKNFNYQFKGQDMQAFISILLFMGLKKYPRMDLHWSTKDDFKDSKIPKIMCKGFFLVIKRAFHLEDNKKINSIFDPFGKISGYVNYLNEKFIKYYTPTQNLAIDETMISYRGRTKFIFYIPSKPTKYGIKMHSVVETDSGYCLKMLLDPGNNHAHNPTGKVINIVRNLTEDLRHRGHIIYLDSWYTSPILAYKLCENGIGVTGMINSNRKHLCKDLISSKERYLFATNGILNLTKFSDDRTYKILHLISTVHNSEMKLKVIKNKCYSMPIVLDYYTTYMRGVDKMNQQISYYQFNHSTKKWWKRIFYALLEIAIFNSFIIYRVCKNQKMKFLEFKLAVANALSDKYISERERMSIRIKFGKQYIYNTNMLHSIVKSEKHRDCKFCSVRKQGQRKCTTYMCKECKINLCPECHSAFHIENIYNKYIKEI